MGLELDGLLIDLDGTVYQEGDAKPGLQAAAGGARLLALQRNRYWRREDGLALDAGPFVAALEYASGQQAVLAGKPSPVFFESAAAHLGLSAGERVGR